jgi:hypothetical protein
MFGLYADVRAARTRKRFTYKHSKNK